MSMKITELEELRAKLKDLRIEHRRLDQQIHDLIQGPYVDHLFVQRLKKRKLLIKDSIVKYESQLIPDLNA